MPTKSILTAANMAMVARHHVLALQAANLNTAQEADTCLVLRRIASLANLTSSIMSGQARFVHQGGGAQDGLANYAYRC